MRFVLLLLCLITIAADIESLAATPARLCHQSCGAMIEGCIAGGGRRRACRRRTIRQCRRSGTEACLVVPSTTTTTPPAPATTTTKVVPTTSTTTTTVAPQGLAGLLGTWDFTYSIISTYHDRYVLSSIQISDDGIPFILAYDVYGGVSDAVVTRPADLGFPTFPYEFALLDAGPFVCDFFVFDKTGPNAVSGEYFLSDVDFDGTCGSLLNASDPYPMSGLRTAAPVMTAGGAPNVANEAGLEIVRHLFDAMTRQQ